MNFKLPAFFILAAMCCVSTASAQPGVSDPLMTGINGYYFGNSFTAGSVIADRYTFRIEQIIPDNPGDEIFVYMFSNGPRDFLGSSFQFPKEELHFMAIDWRGATPGTYQVYAFVAWPAGIGAVTGNRYPAGGTVITQNIVVR